MSRTTATVSISVPFYKSINCGSEFSSLTLLIPRPHAGTFPTAPPSKLDISKSHKVEGVPLNTWIRS